MSADLTFVIGGVHSLEMKWLLAYDRLRCPRRYDLFNAIDKQCLYELPPEVDFDWYDDEGLTTRTVDPHGSKLLYILAKDLADLLLVFDGEDVRLLGLGHYFRSLEPKQPIVLWWS